MSSLDEILRESRFDVKKRATLKRGIDFIGSLNFKIDKVFYLQRLWGYFSSWYWLVLWKNYGHTSSFWNTRWQFWNIWHWTWNHKCGRVIKIIIFFYLHKRKHKLKTLLPIQRQIKSVVFDNFELDWDECHVCKRCFPLEDDYSKESLYCHLEYMHNREFQRLFLKCPLCEDYWVENKKTVAHFREEHSEMCKRGKCCPYLEME